MLTLPPRAVFKIPQTHNMLTSLFDPRTPKSVSRGHELFHVPFRRLSSPTWRSSLVRFQRNPAQHPSTPMTRLESRGKKQRADEGSDARRTSTS